jgi:hypothetical protein
VNLDSTFRINLVVSVDATELAQRFKVPVADVRAELRTAAAQALWDVINKDLGVEASVKEA